MFTHPSTNPVLTTTFVILGTRSSRTGIEIFTAVTKSFAKENWNPSVGIWGLLPERYEGSINSYASIIHLTIKSVIVIDIDNNDTSHEIVCLKDVIQYIIGSFYMLTKHTTLLSLTDMFRHFCCHLHCYKRMNIAQYKY